MYDYPEKTLDNLYIKFRHIHSRNFFKSFDCSSGYDF